MNQPLIGGTLCIYTVEVSKAEKRSDLKVIDASSARFARACKAICIAKFCIEFRSKEMRFDLDE